MGLMKREMMRQEDIRFSAIGVALEAGNLKRCEFHDDIVLENWGDPKDAYRLGNAKFSRGEAGDFLSRREMTDTIKSVIEEAGEECPCCAKWRKA